MKKMIVCAVIAGLFSGVASAKELTTSEKDAAIAVPTIVVGGVTIGIISYMNRDKLYKAYINFRSGGYKNELRQLMEQNYDNSDVVFSKIDQLVKQIREKEPGFYVFDIYKGDDLQKDVSSISETEFFSIDNIDEEFNDLQKNVSSISETEFFSIADRAKEEFNEERSQIAEERKINGDSENIIGDDETSQNSLLTTEQSPKTINDNASDEIKSNFDNNNEDNYSNRSEFGDDNRELRDDFRPIEE